ncbi:MAG: enoyl-CoA hydratase/isomerase family protein [Bdellovibrionales bacterium]|nr:enoyl-CoA hydratase/isomerase family protein [Bdellovibrionales bacterium]
MIRAELCEDGVLELRLCDPKGENRLGRADYLDFFGELTSCAGPKCPLKGIVLLAEHPEGAKRRFSVGADLRELLTDLETPELAIDRIARCSRPAAVALEEFARFGVHSVAAISGVAAGGGFELALACSERFGVVGERRLVGLPEVLVGLVPGNGGIQRLPRLVDREHRAEVLNGIRTGTYWSSEDALRLGLISRLLRSEELVAAAHARVLELEGQTSRSPLHEEPFEMPALPTFGALQCSDEVRARLDATLDTIVVTTARTGADYSARLAIERDPVLGWQEAAKLGLWRERIPALLG